MCKLYLRLTFLYILFLFNLFYPANRVRASFTENFNGNLDNSAMWWSSNAEGISFSSEDIILRSSTPYKFPFLRTSSPIATPTDTTISVKFKFDNAGTNFGDGFALTDTNPILGTVMSYPTAFAKYTIFYVWHTPSSPFFHIVTFLCPIDSSECAEGKPLLIHQTTISDLEPHVLDVTLIEKSYSVKLDGRTIFTSSKTNRFANNFWAGHPETTNTPGVWASLSIDYLKTFNGIDQTFPYLSQKDILWAGKEYDSASGWAGIGKDGIDRWGCALTSTAMMLKNYNVKNPSGGDITPDILNTWLKSQPDGYIGNGLLNWLAVTRYVKQSYDANQSPTKLEFERSALSTTTPSLPAILVVPGHFVVAHGVQSLDWLINDPSSVAKKTLPLTSTVRSVNRFVPSLTDLSNILLATSESLEIALQDMQHNPLPINWFDDHLTDDIDGVEASNYRTAIIQKPGTAKYHLEVQNSNQTPSTLWIYLYDKNGEVISKELAINPGKTIYLIDFDKDSVVLSDLAILDTTPPETPEILGFLDPELPCGSITNTPIVSIDWSDATDNVATTDYEYEIEYPLPSGIGRATWSTNTKSSIYRGSLNEGMHRVKVRALDAAGNISQWSNSCELTRDSVAPTFLSSTSFNGWHVTPQIASFSYSDPHLKTDYLDPSCTIATEGLTQTCTISPMICDLADNCNYDLQTSNHADIDLSAPLSSFVVPRLSNSDSIQVSGTASDSISGVAKVDVSIRSPDGSVRTEIASGTTNWEYELSNLASGKYTLQSQAYDQAGNVQATPYTSEVRFDYTAPDSPQITKKMNLFNIAFVAWKPVKTAKSYSVYVSKHDEPSTVATVHQIHWSTSKLKDGKYQFYVTAIDAAGNESKPSQKISFVNYFESTRNEIVARVMESKLTSFDKRLK